MVFGIRRASNFQNARSRRPHESVEDRKVRKMEEFRTMLVDPDEILVRRKDCRLWFGLTNEDMKKLDHSVIMKQSPYEAGDIIRQYMLPDVVELAKSKHSEQKLLENYESHLRLKPEAGRHEKIYGFQTSPLKPYWYSAPSTKTSEGRKSVRQGLISNSCIAVVKGSVWLGTGSHAIFADMMHSLADVANYAYRLFTLPQAQQRPDRTHPYGYSPMRYITADRSFVILGGLGFVIPFGMAGIELFHHLQHAKDVVAATPELFVATPAAILLISMVLEGIAVRTAYKEILTQTHQDSAGGLNPLERCYKYVREGPEIMSVATITEAGSGVLGAGVGLFGLGLTYYFQSPVFDAASALVMSGIVGAVSAFLLRRSGEMLLGHTLPVNRVEHLVSCLEALDSIVAVYDVKTEVVGIDTVRFKAEIQFNPQAITESLLLQVEKKPPRRDTSFNHEQLIQLRGEKACSMSANLTGQPVQPYILVRERLVQELAEVLPGLRKSHQSKEEAEDWLFENNNLFYEALAWETKNVERILQNELSEFRNIHIDLEPW